MSTSILPNHRGDDLRAFRTQRGLESLIRTFEGRASVMLSLVR
jgi:hypothetical protein